MKFCLLTSEIRRSAALGSQLSAVRREGTEQRADALRVGSAGALADGGEASEQRRAARAVAQVQVVRFEGELQTPRLSQRRVEQPLADLSLIHKVHQ